jgi:predicted nucleic acid-binding protein
MYNALELFRAARTQDERDAVKKMLMAVRVLGFNFRYSEQFSEFAQSIEDRSGTRMSHRETLVLGMAHISKLTVLTREYYDRYASLTAVEVVKSAPLVPA